MKFDHETERMYQLLIELRRAMKSQPGMSAIDVIYAACELKFPTRTRSESFFDGYNGSSKKRNTHNLTNEDIMMALKSYNDLRRKDWLKNVCK